MVTKILAFFAIASYMYAGYLNIRFHTMVSNRDISKPLSLMQGFQQNQFTSLIAQIGS